MRNFRTVFLALGLCMAATAIDARPAAAQASITCESQGNKFKDCSVATGGKVRLVQNISNTRCEYGRTWGFDWNSIWVDRGCRGKFMVNGSGSGWQSGNYGQRVKCESQGGSFKICDVATYGYVRLVQQISQSPCVAGRTWGYQANQIWVGNGCRAEFEVGYGDSNWEGDARVVTCASTDGRYSRCFTRTDGQVTLQKQLSSQACVLQRTWGYDRNGIWVDNGCRGQFVVGRGGPGSGWGEYPGTWPGPGGTRPPTGGSIVDRGKVACDNEARIRGYNNVSLVNAIPSGSTVNVSLRGFRSNREYVVNCQYASNNNVARLTSEDPVGSGGGGGNGLVGRGSDACSNKASTMGYQNVSVTNARQSSSNVTVNMTARSQNRPWNLTCIYRQSQGGSATITEQSEAGGGNGGGSGNLYQDAQVACENRAKVQGYQVIGSGPASLQSWGVKHNLALRKGGLQYSSAYCQYQKNSGSATVIPGNPDKQAR